MSNSTQLSSPQLNSHEASARVKAKKKEMRRAESRTDFGAPLEPQKGGIKAAYLAGIGSRRTSPALSGGHLQLQLHLHLQRLLLPLHLQLIPQLFQRLLFSPLPLSVILLPLPLATPLSRFSISSFSIWTGPGPSTYNFPAPPHSTLQITPTKAIHHSSTDPSPPPEPAQPSRPALHHPLENTINFFHRDLFSIPLLLASIRIPGTALHTSQVPCSTLGA